MMATTRVSDCLERTILPALFSRVVACRLDSPRPPYGLPLPLRNLQCASKDSCAASDGVSEILSHSTKNWKVFDCLPSGLTMYT